MRRMIAISVVLAAAVAGMAGCTSSSKSSSTTAAAKHATSGGTGSGSSSSVCSDIRGAVTSDMAPIGKALGSLVGSSVSGSASGKAKARTELAAAVKKLGADVQAKAEAGDDQAVKDGAKKAAANLDALATDPTFLPHIKSMGDIATATTKLQTATAPLTSACSGS